MSASMPITSLPPIFVYSVPLLDTQDGLRNSLKQEFFIFLFFLYNDDTRARHVSCFQTSNRVQGHFLKDMTCGVTVSMSVFLACHQCYCAGSSLVWGLNLRAVICGTF